MGLTYVTALPQVNTVDLISSVQGPAVFDKQAVIDWLELLHGTSPGLMHLCSDAARGQKANWSGRTFSDVADAADYAERLDARGDKGIYVRTTTLARPIGVFERGSEKDSKALPGFAFDIDIAGPGHKHKPDMHEGRHLPPDEATAMQVVLGCGLPEPTLWVHSGGGLYPWWMFNEPLDVASTGDMPELENLTRAQTVSDMMDRILFHAFKDAGWDYGTGVNDSARILRLPGTVNRKDDTPPRPCRMLDPASYTFYDLESLFDDVQDLHEKLPAPPAPVPMVPTTVRVNSGTLSPGDDFENKVDWADQLLLGGAGWTLLYQRGNERHWRRPGKDRGTLSATTGHANDRERLYVMSTECAPFPYKEPVTKFHAYALLHHNADHSAAGKFLKALGYGEQTPLTPQGPTVNLADLIRPAAQAAEPTPAVIPAEPAAVEAVQADKAAPRNPFYFQSDVGNGQRIRDKYGDQFRRCDDEDAWYQWSGKRWEKDTSRAVVRAAKDITFDMFREGTKLKEDNPEAGSALQKWAVTSQSAGKVFGAAQMFATEPGITIPATAFDRTPHRITVGNGVLNLHTGQLEAFDKDLLARRMFAADFNPAATAPRFEAFLAQVLPDAQVRDYVQRAMAYTLLGEANKKALFLVHGPSNTGKSQFLLLMQNLFGDFGTAAAAATFRNSKNPQTNDLHDLMGKRFVTTSETSQDARLDEELIKRLTGRDAVVSRQLYQANVGWTPEMTIWMATNFLPKLGGDDDAMWKRVKPIKFGVVFSTEEGSDNAEVSDIGLSILAEESSGILNWLMAGMVALRERGLDEPETVKDDVEKYRIDSNNVAEFLADALDAEILVPTDIAGESVPVSHLFDLYEKWCRSNRVDHPYGQKRFGNRVRSLYEVRKISTYRCIGIAVGTKHGFFGTM